MVDAVRLKIDAIVTDYTIPSYGVVQARELGVEVAITRIHGGCRGADARVGVTLT